MQGIAGQDIDLKTTSVSDVKDKVAEIQSEVEAISNSKSELSDQVKSDLKDAFDQFKSDLADVKDASTLEEAGQQIETARHELPRCLGRHPGRSQLLGHHDGVAVTVEVP